MPLECTNVGYVETRPCLQCLSNSELKAVLVYVLATINSKVLATDLPTMMSDSACTACLTDKQLFIGMLSAMMDGVIAADMSINDIRAQINCLTCVDPHRVNALALQEFCVWMGTPA